MEISKSRKYIIFSSIALSLFLTTLVMGVAGQYFVGVIALLVMANGAGKPQAGRWRQVWQDWRWVVLSGLAFVLWLVFAGYENPAATTSPWTAVGGYLDWLLWAPLIALWVGNWRRGLTPCFWQWALVLALVWSAVCLSQYLLGWKFAGGMLAPDMERARGFVSHPLTLAYMTLVLWPPALEVALQKRQAVIAWALVAALALAAFTSLSRTVQVLVLTYGVLRVGFAMPRRWLPALLLLVVLGGLGVGLTDNPVRDRFARTMSGEGVDRHQNIYADDRLAFWAAHRLMIAERPWLGHGPDINRAYRLPYYARLGLGDFIKPYEAHNQYLQILAEGGVIGLILWFAWLLALGSLIWRQAPRARLPLVGLMVLFLLGGLTQNAFQDAEVRYVFLVTCVFLWVFARPVPDTTPSLTFEK